MPNFFALQCPTCGARLEVAGASQRFVCQHCHNHYLLDRPLEALPEVERENLQPTTTYTHQLQQWLKVAGYEVCVQAIAEETVKTDRVLSIEVEYRNATPVPLTCRHDQWVVFDAAGYTYEPVKDFVAPELYEPVGKRYLGLTRILTPGMKLRGWLVFRLPASTRVAYLQFSGGTPAKTVEFQLVP